MPGARVRKQLYPSAKVQPTGTGGGKVQSSSSAASTSRTPRSSDPRPVGATGPRYTKSVRAGLTFPVARVHRHLRAFNRGSFRVGDLPAVYLVAELVELAGNAAKEFKKQRIQPRHVKLAIANDAEFVDLIGPKAIMPSGGVLPGIHAALIAPYATRFKTMLPKPTGKQGKHLKDKKPFTQAAGKA